MEYQEYLKNQFLKDSQYQDLIKIIFLQFLEYTHQQKLMMKLIKQYNELAIVEDEKETNSDKTYN